MGWNYPGWWEGSAACLSGREEGHMHQLVVQRGRGFGQEGYFNMSVQQAFDKVLIFVCFPTEGILFVKRFGG